MRANFDPMASAISFTLFFGVPKGLRFSFSRSGVTMFMRSIAKDTPSFIVPNDHGEEAQPQTVDDHRDGSLGRGGVVRRHEECAEHQTAAEQIGPHILAHIAAVRKEDGGEERRGADVQHGDLDVDDAADGEIETRRTAR